MHPSIEVVDVTGDPVLDPPLVFRLGNHANGYLLNGGECLAVFCDAANLHPIVLAAIGEQVELHGYAQLAESDEDSLIFVPKQ